MELVKYVLQTDCKFVRKQAEWFESLPNNLEVGWMVYKQPQWHESWPNDLHKHTGKVVSQVRANMDRILKGLVFDPKLRLTDLLFDFDQTGLYPADQLIILLNSLQTGQRFEIRL